MSASSQGLIEKRVDRLALEAEDPASGVVDFAPRADRLARRVQVRTGRREQRTTVEAKHVALEALGRAVTAQLLRPVAVGPAKSADHQPLDASTVSVGA